MPGSTRKQKIRCVLAHVSVLVFFDNKLSTLKRFSSIPHRDHMPGCAKQALSGHCEATLGPQVDHKVVSRPQASSSARPHDFLVFTRVLHCPFMPTNTSECLPSRTSHSPSTQTNRVMEGSLTNASRALIPTTRWRLLNIWTKCSPLASAIIN